MTESTLYNQTQSTIDVERYIDLKEKYETLQEEIKVIELEKGEYQREIKKLELQNEDLQQQIKLVMERDLEIQTSSPIFTKSIASMSVALEDMDHEKEALNTELQEDRDIIDKLKKENYKINKQNKKFEILVETLQKQQNEKEIHHKNDIKALNEKINELNIENKQIGDEFNDFRIQIEELEERENVDTLHELEEFEARPEIENDDDKPYTLKVDRVSSRKLKFNMSKKQLLANWRSQGSLLKLVDTDLNSNDMYNIPTSYSINIGSRQSSRRSGFEGDDYMEIPEENEKEVLVEQLSDITFKYQQLESTHKELETNAEKSINQIEKLQKKIEKLQKKNATRNREKNLSCFALDWFKK